MFRRFRKKGRWPPLSKIDPNKKYSGKKRKETPEAVRKLLQPISTLEIGEPNSSESDVSDVFEDLHEESFLHAKKSGRKDVTKHEANILTMNQFTDLFKNTMKDIKRELNIGENMLNEEYEDIVKVIEMKKESKELPPDIVASINKTLSDPERVQPSEEIPRKMSALTYDYNSGIWNMIEEHCRGKEFTVSPVDYNVYNQQEPHWLQKEELPQSTMDESRVKCHKWLQEQHEQ